MHSIRSDRRSIDRTALARADCCCLFICSFDRLRAVTLVDDTCTAQPISQTADAERPSRLPIQRQSWRPTRRRSRNHTCCDQHTMQTQCSSNNASSRHRRVRVHWDCWRWPTATTMGRSCKRRRRRRRNAADHTPSPARRPHRRHSSPRRCSPLQRGHTAAPLRARGRPSTQPQRPLASLRPPRAPRRRPPRGLGLGLQLRLRLCQRPPLLRQRRRRPRRTSWPSTPMRVRRDSPHSTCTRT